MKTKIDPILKRKRRIVVTKINKISKNMKRLTFSHEDLYDFPESEVGGYVKLIFPDKNDLSKSFSRPFTVRNYRRNLLEIDIDFVIHDGDHGYASSWLNSVNNGDEIFITGPGPRERVSYQADWFFFIGDMSAIPAISVNLEMLPRNACGIVILEILSNQDKIKLIKPENININWVIDQESNLLESVSNFKWLRGTPYVWVACEFSKMKSLRNFFQIKKKIEKTNMYISSYWKSGLNQEEHKVLKKNDSERWIL